jgi:hypothetical protein
MHPITVFLVVYIEMPNRLTMQLIFDNLHEDRLTIPLTPPMSNGLLPSLSTTRITTPVMINYSNEAIKSLEDRNSELLQGLQCILVTMGANHL